MPRARPKRYSGRLASSLAPSCCSSAESPSRPRRLGRPVPGPRGHRPRHSTHAAVPQLTALRQGPRPHSLPLAPVPGLLGLGQRSALVLGAVKAMRSVNSTTIWARGRYPFTPPNVRRRCIPGSSKKNGRLKERWVGVRDTRTDRAAAWHPCQDAHVDGGGGALAEICTCTLGARRSRL